MAFGVLSRSEFVIGFTSNLLLGILLNTYVIGRELNGIVKDIEITSFQID